MGREEKTALEDIHYVKLVSIGSVNPNNPLSDQSREAQTALLNRCLNEYPRGIILGRDVTVGKYLIGDHQLTMEKITYHVGFARKPSWEEDSSI
ncbi:MAG: hypothetical protein K2G28_08730 [Acetatifactor sp.]|nr:hypothetical protein [Acetatifactor sp.]MDE7353290.1 hypothetical protein [Acetatifactor sp.]